MNRKRGQEIFHLVAMIGFVGVGAGLAATGYRVSMDFTNDAVRSAGTYAWLGMLLTVPFAAILFVGGVGLNLIDRAYPPPADTAREPPAPLTVPAKAARMRGRRSAGVCTAPPSGIGPSRLFSPASSPLTS